jgi:hypothetical protein
MTNDEIFDLAETHGWQDDFGRWNFKDDGLIKFVLAIKQAEWVGLTANEIWGVFTLDYMDFARAIEAKLKEKNL